MLALKLKFIKLFSLYILFLGCFAFSAHSQQKIDKFYLSNFHKDGSRNWELLGKYAVVFDEYSEIYESRALFFRKDNNVRVRANKAVISNNDNSAKLTGNIQARSEDGMVLFAKTLNWNELRQELETKSGVKVCSKDVRIRATGMFGEGVKKAVSFLKNIKVTIINEKHKDKVIVTCLGPLEVEFNRGKAVFFNNVVLKSTDGTVYSDKAVAFYDKKSKKIVKIISVGNVRFIKDGNKTFSQKAVYLGREGKIKLIGRPKILLYPKEGSTLP